MLHSQAKCHDLYYRLIIFFLGSGGGGSNDVLRSDVNRFVHLKDGQSRLWAVSQRPQQRTTQKTS